MSSKDIDKLSGTETTGHEWDGIKELNTPLPRWWLWTFYGSIVFALGYVIAYPAIPLINSATPGLLNWSTRANLDASLEAAKAAQGSLLQQVADTPVADIVANQDLARFAAAGGKSLFKVYCVQCHGTGAMGGPGYPNLNDDDWVWGGSVDQIYTTLTHGVRWEADADTRYNIMPNFGADGLLEPNQITVVAKYVAALSGIEGGENTPEGAQLFSENCAACHGPAGEGMQDMGGPSLKDAIWLYDGSLAGIEAQVTKPRHGVMPAWGARLGDTAVKQLAVYVHSLGGGQ